MTYVDMVDVKSGAEMFPERGAVGPGKRVEFVNKAVVSDVKLNDIAGAVGPGIKVAFVNKPVVTFAGIAGAVGPGRRVELVNKPVITDVTFIGIAGAVGPSEVVRFVITLGTSTVELIGIITPVGPTVGIAVGPLVRPTEVKFPKGPVGAPDGVNVEPTDTPVGTKVGTTVTLIDSDVKFATGVDIGSPLEPDEVILGRLVRNPDGVGEPIGLGVMILPISGAPV